MQKLPLCAELQVVVVYSKANASSFEAANVFIQEVATSFLADIDYV